MRDKELYAAILGNGKAPRSVQDRFETQLEGLTFLQVGGIEREIDPTTLSFDAQNHLPRSL